MEKSSKVFQLSPNRGRETEEAQPHPNAFGAARRPHYTGRPINMVEHETDLERRNQLWARKLRNCEIQRKNFLRPLDVPGRKRHRKVSSHGDASTGNWFPVHENRISS